MLRGDGIRKKGGKWTVRYTDAHGQRREVVVEAKTRGEAKEKRAQLVSKVKDQRLGIWDGDADATFADAWKLYRPIAKALANWRTIEIYWRRHIQPAFGEKKIRQVSKNDIKRWLATKSEKLEPRTCEHLRVRLGALFNFAADEGIYRGENMASAIGALNVPEKESRFIEWDIIQPVLDVVAVRWRPFFALAVYTGLRSGELRALTKESVSPDWRYLTVSKSGSRQTTKTKRVRRVPLPRAALPYLQAALKASEGRPWVFVDEEGKQLGRSIDPTLVLRQALAKLGLVKSWVAFCQRGCAVREPGRPNADGWRCPKCSVVGKVEPEHDLTFHDLRKTWETHLEELAGDPLSVARLAGHSPEVAARHYLGGNLRRLAAVADKLDFRVASPSLPRTGLEESGSRVLSDATDSGQLELIGEGGI